VYRTAVIGCGLIGKRRAKVCVEHEGSRLDVVVDNDAAIAQATGESFGCAATTDWHAAIANPAIDIVVISTPNFMLAEIAEAALAAGKHVLLEKPMGRNIVEARRIQAAALRADRVVKVGFNHRYHPAISRAHELFRSGEIGRAINVRARYGHGGRPGYEREWRGNPEMAGGGELTDQGVHILDLLQWFIGSPERVFSRLQTAVWPIAPLEDNGFALLEYPGNVIASFHTSWTQWKNLFSFEVYGTEGSLTIDGLGKSYGPERLIVAKRRPEGGAPEMVETAFPGEDESWALEWADFLAGLDGAAYLGNPDEGVAVMAALDALYRSASENRPASVVP